MEQSTRVRRSPSATYRTFARRIYRELDRRGLISPSRDTLNAICEAMFFASLRTEEAQAIACSLVYIDPDNPDPDPPGREVRDRWSLIRLADEIQVSDIAIAKLAQASDPRSSSFAMFSRSKGKAFVWSLVDQQNRYYDFLNHDSSSGPERPGVFELNIRGPAHLVCSVDYDVVAELRISELVNKPIDVLARGAIHRGLIPGIESCIDEVKREVTLEEFADRPWNAKSLESYYLDAIRRLLLRIKNLGHGGAIVVSPDRSLGSLDLKYKIDYGRFRKSIGQRGASVIRECYAADKLFKYLDSNADEIPVDLYLQESVSATEVEESGSELDGAIWFIALLSRVDGAVVLTQEFDVKGFGAEICIADEPNDIYLATNAAASPSKIRPFDYRHFGTRHRSMMRYCNAIEGSVGFVVSQDGDVRAMTKRRGKLLVWDNIQLQYAKSKKVRRKER